MRATNCSYGHVWYHREKFDECMSWSSWNFRDRIINQEMVTALKGKATVEELPDCKKLGLTDLFQL
jgi:hypothetical protein